MKLLKDLYEKNIHNKNYHSRCKYIRKKIENKTVFEKKKLNVFLFMRTIKNFSKLQAIILNLIKFQYQMIL